MLRCIEAGARIGYMPGFYARQYLHEGEHISLGQNKIDGEKLLYGYKRKYFSLLTRKEKKYVTFRHFAVLAFACKRSRFYGKALLYAVRTVLASPVNCAKEAKRFLKR